QTVVAAGNTVALPVAEPIGPRDRECCELQYIHCSLGCSLRHRGQYRTTGLVVVLIQVRASVRDLWRHSQCTLIPTLMHFRYSRVLAPAVMLFVLFGTGSGQNTSRITLDQAIDLALAHNHSLKATRTLILQNQAQEITANLRPNPTLGMDSQFVPFFSPQDFSGENLNETQQFDVGIGYLFERGHKRQ